MLPPRPSTSLRHRLQTAISAPDVSALSQLLRRMPHSERRAAATLLSDELLWRELDDTAFWQRFCALVVSDARAYLGTLLKAVAARFRKQGLRFDDPSLALWASQEASTIDRHKTLEALLPLIDTPNSLRPLLKILRFDAESESTQTILLMRAATPASYFLLFGLLRRWDDRPSLLRRYAVELMRRGSSTDFRMASLLATYFDLEPLPGCFSLHLEAYQLSRLAENFESFNRILQG